MLTSLFCLWYEQPLTVIIRVLNKIRLVALRFGLLSDTNVSKTDVTAAVYVAR